MSCPVHMYLTVMHVCNACMQCMHIMYVCIICNQCMHVMYVGLCSICMSNVHAMNAHDNVCNVCNQCIYVKYVCSHACDVCV